MKVIAMNMHITKVALALLALTAASACSFAPSQAVSMERFSYTPSQSVPSVQTQMTLESY